MPELYVDFEPSSPMRVYMADKTNDGALRHESDAVGIWAGREFRGSLYLTSQYIFLLAIISCPRFRVHFVKRHVRWLTIEIIRQRDLRLSWFFVSKLPNQVEEK